MDKFPEAFRRFEQVVDISKIKSFQQLLTAFRLWAGRKWINSAMQLEALKVEAFKREIPQIPVSPEEYETEKNEINQLYARIRYCRNRYVYNETHWKVLTIDRFRARGTRRIQIERRIREAEERMRFWKTEWESAYQRLKLARARFKLKIVEVRKIRD